MKIREATEKDLESLNELQITLVEYEKEICGILKDPKSVKDTYSKEYEEKIKREDCVFFVAEEDGKIVGYILGRIEKPSHEYIYEKRGSVDDAFVMEKYRREGVGEKLTQGLEGWFKSKGIKWIRVAAYANNKLGINFWKKMGFKDYVIWLDKRVG